MVVEAEKKLCFEREELQNSDLSVTEFVAKARAQAPLSTLREDLKLHLDELQEDLIEELQTNFSAFISLGRAVADADERADAVQVPMRALQQGVQGILESFGSDIHQLEKTLDKRRQLAARRKLLELFLRISDLVHKCERLLKEMEACGPRSEERLRILERTATESAQLKFCLGKVDEKARFVIALEPQLEKLSKEVKRRLEQWLKDALRSDRETVARALAAFVAAGMVDDAERLFRAEIVAPFAHARLRMSACTAAAEKKKEKSGDSVTTADALEAAHEFIRAFVQDKCVPIISLCDAEERLRAFDFVNRSIWPEIEHGLATNMSVFSPGIAAIFHRSFTIASDIFAVMEKACSTPERVAVLHAHDATNHFWRKWSLPVYFQLRFREITSSFEDALDLPPSGKAEDDSKAAAVAEGALDRRGSFRLLSPESYHMASSKALVVSLKRCWEPDVFLQPLTHKFLRLCLQLLARYTHWVRDGVEGAWETSSPVKELSLVYSDVETLRERLGAELASTVRMGSVNALPDQVTTSVDTAFAASIDDLSSLLPVLAEKISGLVSKSCVDALQPLRGILATYRMTNRPAPTQHSYFVGNVLKPLREFMGSPDVRISEAERLKVGERVVEATVEKYLEMTTNLLANVRQTADTLRRLNIGRQDGAAKTVGSNAEMDKITMQLYLDVRKFGSDIDALGISSESSPAYRKLRDCVQVEFRQTEEEGSTG